MGDRLTDAALIAAENYEKNVVTYTTGPFATILIEHARPLPGEKVLDVACGTGTVARQVAPIVGAAGTVVAVDNNPAMLEVARRLPNAVGASIDWREGNALELPLPEGSFDLVLCQAGLQFFPDRAVALGEMYRVLRPGGRVAISVARSIEYNPASALIWGTIARHLNTTTDLLARGFSLGDAGELRALLESVNFTDLTITPRSYVVREPLNPMLIKQMLTSISVVVPAFAAMNPEEQSALAQAVEEEIRPDLQAYVEGDEQLYPMSIHIAIAFKQ